MKIAELRDKTVLELQELLLELRRSQFNLRMQKASDQVAKPSEVRQNRCDIARIKTLLGEKDA